MQNPSQQFIELGKQNFAILETQKTAHDIENQAGKTGEEAQRGAQRVQKRG